MPDNNSITPSFADKPAKPSLDFPLFAHQTGRWAKKIKGKMCYFGPWSEPVGALQRYRDFIEGKPVEKPQRTRSDSTRQSRPGKPYPEFPLQTMAAKLSILVWLVITVFPGHLRASGLQSAHSPNVVFILADDQRFDTIHALGNAEIKSPCLDRLVQQGFAFTNVYCQGGMIQAVCTPSRTMLLTGRSLFRTPDANAKHYVGPTLPSVFRAAGYATLYVGKAGNGFRAANESFEKFVYNDERPEARDMQSQFTADEAIKFMRQPRGGQPFFIFLAPPVPHDPRVAPKEFMALYDPAKISLSKNFMPRHPFDNGELRVRDELLAPHPRTPDDMQRHLADYYACITCLDYHIGRILDALKQTGHAEDTIVFFTSDQGLAVGGRHGLMGKQNLYEEFKSPLIVTGPGISRGKSDELVYLFDLFPTLCALIGTRIPPGTEGASLVPILMGHKPRVRQWLFAAYRDVQRMVRDERWKLIWYPKVNRFQLFDLTNDPWEIDDLADKTRYANKLRELKEQLAQQQKAFGDSQSRPPF